MSPTLYISRPAGEARAFDVNYLNGLGQGRAGDLSSPAAQKEVARQFEALFIQQWIRQARQAGVAQGMLDSAQTRLAQSLGDEQLALQMADPGIGLARVLLDQLRSARNGAGGGVVDADEPPAQASAPRPRTAPGRAYDAPSISSLIELLTRGAAPGAMISAIRGAPEHIRGFVAKMAAAARSAADETGIPAKLILSQAALESGWGRREISADDGSASFNLFGIKAGSRWAGKVVHVLTTEYENGAARKVVQPFRAYGSYAESFSDYARLMSRSPRYGDVAGADTAEEAARRIQRAGYATDPDYAGKLISIMAYFDTAAP